MRTFITVASQLGYPKTSILKGIYEGNTPHISEWKTTSSNETITLPYQSNGIYNGIIDWGDGTTSINSYENRTHIYITAGTYTITIYGRIRIFRFADAGDKNKIYRIFQWGSLFDVGVGGAHFYGCSNLDLSIVSDVLILFRVGQLSYTQNFANMFRDCTSLTTINRVNEWDVSKIKTMANCFYNCINLNQSLNSWNTTNVTDMSQMFFGCTLFNGNISSWQTISVTDMLGMFRLAPNFNQDISAWNTSNVTTMRGMFYQANSFNQNIGAWDVSNVNDIQTGFINFMFGKTFANYSTANYDALLIGWASRPVQPNLSINFGTIKRTAAATAARLVLTSAPNNWTIVDGGI